MYGPLGRRSTRMVWRKRRCVSGLAVSVRLTVKEKYKEGGRRKEDEASV